MAYIDHPFFGKWPCITENSYGKGHLIYLATVPSQDLLQKIVARAANRIGLLPFNGKYRYPVIMR
ncbi:beta-galactosidase trimerization domain-containing protein [uncultured Bacteroides sp.]|uniref:beta-galactosidase trimerization domain-containing protein n=1 Tax=uncultured Bacteroides sp. TaxID=162156 RepID=UPI002AA8F51A|nr:beta-galactosidase trimerization domain-containing protein [uncultured Bacteroides sp.]